MKLFLYVLFVLSLVDISCTAQISGAFGHKCRHIGMEDGLSNDLVTCMVQDSMGYVWVGTENGLSRYDGHSFTAESTSKCNITKSF